MPKVKLAMGAGWAVVVAVMQSQSLKGKSLQK
jgi:hypothetical protein